MKGTPRYVLSNPEGPIAIIYGRTTITPSPLMAVGDPAEPSPLEARKLVENDVARILAWDDAHQALLFDLMVKAGWSRDRATTVLRKKGWHLG